ncbi:Na/Pi cotransporter family protein [Mediterraneibacter catenae]|uniref:Na/Pi cotransporter family protein n=1 Tax=Mediterraneibacter catenae TaxID=2594882 RepID=A0A5M9HYX5_9FIRM|nr:MULTISPECIES: Na/Pi cotransporter family protein [Mediterraneibacter]KAA8501887.1 Na/Pi cotransporter family protein [Mediterraneibacter catenae]MCF2568099.1 Na/Pi cotransporter family protein [Mediterraneibacter glycyrrhizinilyticus]MDN0059988.1 Na/Pi cotransporter family protein [Mediterraneibacter glycyrrhizinilyticus]OUO29356.1 Na/Pi-cotransporter [Lachnoclostridium sp. An298]
MGITDILSLLGGLALFLFGMQTMSNGLEAAAGNKMKSILEKLTSNRIMGVFVGAVITAVIQSSSATTVMVVGFVNSGLMTLNQAVWIIMGANIGTTITGQLIALDIGAIAPLFAIIGVGAIMFSKSEKVHHISGIIAGLGILFIGMDMMGAAMEPLQESEAFLNLMTQFSNPLLGILVGAVFTAVIQSSSASVGILQALAATGMIPLESAVYVLFGQNIGTCITAVLASIGTKVNARRTTVIHLMFNIIGTTIFTIICMTTPYVHLVESITPGDPVAQIANAHTIFNIVTTLILLPFGNYMARAAERILPDSKKEDDEDLRLKYIRPFDSSYSVGNSAIAVTQVKDEVNRMLDMVSKNIGDAFDTLIKYDEKSRQKVEEREEYIDYLNKGISEYIVSLMSGEMNADDSRKINGYYAIISNLERIGDHATNIAEYADDMKKWDLQFSDNVLDELEEMKKQCIASLKNLKNADSGDAQKVLSQAEILEQQTDDMRDKYFKKQMQRLKKGKCKPQSGIVFSEVLTDFERMGDHALNIAQQYKEMG